MLISTFYGSFVPSANAAEMTNQQQGLAILQNVIGLDLSKYSVTTTENPPDKQSSYLGIIPQDTIVYNFASGLDEFKVLFIFSDGHLQTIAVLNNVGNLNYTKTAINGANAVEMAQRYLSNYQAYTGNLFFNELKSTLNNIDYSQNFTKNFEDKILEVTTYNNQTTFKWCYTINGVVAPYSKFVMLSFLGDNFNTFVDNWQFYNVGSSSVNLSEKDAKGVALQAAKAHLSSLKTTAGMEDINNFNESNVCWSSLIFDNSLDAEKTRGSDALALFPVWRIGINLNKWYGQMYGVEVDIWADTGEVRSIQTVWSTLIPLDGTLHAGGKIPDSINRTSSVDVSVDKAFFVADGKVTLFVWAVPALVLVATGAFIVVWLRKKNYSIHLSHPRFLNMSKIICIFILFIIFFASIATVAAVPKAIVWGSESTGASGYPLPDGPSWRKHSTEVSFQQQIAANISQWFNANNYYAINHQGNLGSSRTQILADLSNSQGDDSLAVVDFDHGVGGLPSSAVPLGPDYGLAPTDEFHYMIEDNTGTLTGPYGSTPSSHPENAVYDMDVYSSGKAKTTFTFINTCLSASIVDTVGNYNTRQRMEPAQGSYVQRPIGMPLAWTGRYVKSPSTPGFNVITDISNDGYGNSDLGDQVYIGFPKGSASLEQKIPYNTGTYPYYDWVYSFFYLVLNNDVSVNSALNTASSMLYGQNFGNCPLRTGFNASWWHMDTPDDWSVSTMAVYGNGNIKLHASSLTLNVAEDTGTHAPPYSLFTIGGQVCVPPSYPTTINLVPGAYSVTIGDEHNFVFSHFTYNGQSYYNRPANIQLGAGGSLVAHYNWSPTYYNLTISSSGQGSTTPTGNQPYVSYDYAQVQANPNSGYIHYWTSDLGGDPDYDRTRYVLMDGSHWLQANFVTAPSYNFVSHVEATTGPVGNPAKINGPNNDGQHAAIVGMGPYQNYGSLTSHLYFTTMGHIYVYGCASYSSGPLYVYTSTDGSNWSFVGATTVSQQSPGWIDCGYSTSPFSYVKLTAEYPSNVYTIAVDSVKVDPTLYTLTIQQTGSGTVTPSTSTQYLVDTNAHVTAEAASGWVFDHWVLDNIDAGNNPAIDVYMNTDRTLRAVFTLIPTDTYVSSITGYGGPAGDVDYLVGQPDGQYAGLACFGPYHVYSMISAMLDAQTSGHIYVYGYAEYSGGPLSVYTSTDGSNWNLYCGANVWNSSPGWIDCGTCSSPFRYVMLAAEYPGNVYTIRVDSLKVVP